MRILVVDDEPEVCDALVGFLADEGHKAHAVHTGEEGLRSARESVYDVVFLDVRLPGMGGLEVLQRLRQDVPGTDVVMISGQADVGTAVKATKLGAYDFLEKPLQPERLALLLQHLDERRRMQREVDGLRDVAELEGRLVGSSAAMQRLREQIARAAPSDGRVLIFGENGTGKELVARQIHLQSTRKNGPFVKLNCAAVPVTLVESELFGHVKGAFTGAVHSKKGLLEQADGGTLFLDEVGDMALETQAKLLRVLQEDEFLPVGGVKPRRFDARILAATNKDLEAEMEAGRFRQDLYYRLNVIPLRVPPLRERKEDIPELVHHFRLLFEKRTGRRAASFSPEALQAMSGYDWPGNVRELRNFVERLLIMVPGEEIGVETVVYALGSADAAVAESGGDHRPLRQRLREFEKQVLAEEFRRAQGNIAEMARRLGVDRANLSRRLRQYGIKRGPV